MVSWDTTAKRATTDVERANLAQGKESLAQGKAQLAQGKAQTAQLKNLNKSSQVTNAKLSELNQTSKLIAKANEELVRIQTQALDESNRQTSLLDAQLQIANINELEKNRQNQIKQAAFSIEQQIELINVNNSNFKKYFLFADQLNQINIVGLTPNAPNEISDKQYVRETLKKFDESLSVVKSNLTSDEIKQVDEYYINLTNLSNSIDLKSEYLYQVSLLIEPEKYTGFSGFIKLLNKINSLFQQKLPFTEFIKALNYLLDKKQRSINLLSYETEKNNLEISLAKLNAEIEKYSSLTINFKKIHSIEA
jgi:hypothetical protein